ncbi:MAG: hypothetical protein A2Y16_05385 [Tenericutes bacterium GWF2_57_13]|nr:MAG: hypothetical protein A2Y16_05385 [Tenericutes bacterium GWF2_57_13]
MLLELNCKNLKYAVKGTLGAYGTPKVWTGLKSISLEPNYEEKEVYADGDLVTVLVNDKGYTGEVVVTDKADDFEKDLGFREELAGALADVQQLDRKEVAIYLEIDNQSDAGIASTNKVWLLGVFVSRANDKVQQRESSPVTNDVTYKIRVSGDLKMTADGSAVYVNANGVSQRASKLTARPSHTGYATFGNTVPTPKVAA